jgi:hypothetical protein
LAGGKSRIKAGISFDKNFGFVIRSPGVFRTVANHSRTVSIDRFAENQSTKAWLFRAQPHTAGIRFGAT